MPRRPLAILAAVTLAGALGACGRDAPSPTRVAPQGGGGKAPVLGAPSDGDTPPADLGFPAVATKNTLRFAGSDPAAVAAAVALATFPAETRGTRPGAVALADAGDWRTGVLASVLASAPIRAAVLLSDGSDLPGPTQDALERLGPTGAPAVGGAQVIRVGASTARPKGVRTTDLGQTNIFALARSVDAFQAAAAGRTSDRVIVVSAGDPEYAMPAAAWSAKSGDTVLFTARNSLPADTRRALAAHQKPRIYVLGPPSAVSDAVLTQLRGLGTVRRIGDADPVKNAIAFARFTDAGFGWGAIDPGHGYTFARLDRPADAAASALLGSHGSYAPLLLVRSARRLDPDVESYLLDVQPGYTRDPVRGVYNRGWILGDDQAFSLAVQARIDALLEIQPVTTQTTASAPQGSTTP